MPDWLWWVIGVTSLLGVAYGSMLVGYFWGMFVWMHRNPNYLATQLFPDKRDNPDDVV